MKEQKVLSHRITDFYFSLSPDFALPEMVEVMHPYREQIVRDTVARFYEKFYHDLKPRLILFGINPGRFGAGVTGVPFTDPIRLADNCGIANDFIKRQELSAQFVYDVIEAYGGVGKFYADFFISALSPLGFTRQGKNLNYYDDPHLQQASTPFMLQCIRQQKALLQSPPICFCLGEGSNYRYFCKLNGVHHLFKEIIPLPHPRWVMQYRRKQKEAYVQRYVQQLGEAIEKIKKPIRGQRKIS